MEIPKNLKDEIWEYCRLNDIPNIDDFILKMIRQGYTVEKFGATPIGTTEVQEVEKIVEVPVEVIKEIIVEKEVIKEIPVEKIVTKIEYINDKTNESELTENILHLNEELETERQKFSTITTEMENIFQEEISKRDREIENLRRLLEEDERDEKITTLSNSFEEERVNHRKAKEEISKKDKEIEELKRLLEEEKNKTKKDSDIYGDDRKGGWFGSNLLKKK